MSILYQMKIFGVLTIALSLLNVIVLLTSFEDVVKQQQRIDNKGVYNGSTNLTPSPTQHTGDPEELTFYRAREAWKFEILLHTLNTVVCMILILCNMKEISVCITTIFLGYGLMLFIIGFLVFNLMYISGYITRADNEAERMRDENDEEERISMIEISDPYELALRETGLT